LKSLSSFWLIPARAAGCAGGLYPPAHPRSSTQSCKILKITRGSWQQRPRRRYDRLHGLRNADLRPLRSVQ